LAFTGHPFSWINGTKDAPWVKARLILGSTRSASSVHGRGNLPTASLHSAAAEAAWRRAAVIVSLWENHAAHHIAAELSDEEWEAFKREQDDYRRRQTKP
jgi:hypothetical protein